MKFFTNESQISTSFSGLTDYDLTGALDTFNEQLNSAIEFYLFENVRSESLYQAYINYGATFTYSYEMTDISFGAEFSAIFDFNSYSYTWSNILDNSLSATQIVFIPFYVTIFDCYVVSNTSPVLTFTIEDMLDYEEITLSGYIYLKSPELTSQAYTMSSFTQASSIASAIYANVNYPLVSNGYTSYGWETIVTNPLTVSNNWALYNLAVADNGVWSDTDTVHLNRTDDIYFVSSELATESYSETWQYGYDSGFDAGYDVGYDDGYDVGYDDGYDVGTDMPDFFKVIGDAFESVGSVLNVEIFYGMTIGTLIFIPLCFAVIMFIIDKIKS